MNEVSTKSKVYNLDYMFFKIKNGILKGFANSFMRKTEHQEKSNGCHSCEQQAKHISELNDRIITLENQIVVMASTYKEEKELKLNNCSSENYGYKTTDAEEKRDLQRKIDDNNKLLKYSVTKIISLENSLFDSQYRENKLKKKVQESNEIIVRKNSELDKYHHLNRYLKNLINSNHPCPIVILKDKQYSNLTSASTKLKTLSTNCICNKNNKINVTLGNNDIRISKIPIRCQPLRSQSVYVQSQQVPVQSKPGIKISKIPVRCQPLRSQPVQVRSQLVPAQNQQVLVQSRAVYVHVRSQSVPVQSQQVLVQSQSVYLLSQQVPVRSQLGIKISKIPVCCQPIPVQSLPEIHKKKDQN